ncbi:UPF0481 protein At3g47200-like isoform X2 [Musa acuminata AAA Group]|uniref:UPF0481 protein At3g47200-like isoform X2 n=1 Tax=Musa acuminata AAA Group TaxID=214697 RepID=UPI0031D32769
MNTVEEAAVIALDMEWVRLLEKRVEDTQWGEEWRTKRPTIYRVPNHIRDSDPDAYEPMIVSIGPYHHDKPRLQAMNHIKWHYLKQFLGRNPHKVLADYLREIKDKERDIRMAYSEQVDKSSNDFLQMMLLDGCFVIEMLLYWKGQGGLEAAQNPITSPSSLMIQIPSRSVDFHHILHLLHSRVTPPKKLDKMKSQSSDSNRSLPWMNRLCCCGEDPEVTDEPVSLLGWIPSATKLREAGVHFRRKKEATSFLDISFKNKKMEIPQLQVDDGTNALFRNLIAFEQCYDEVSSHVTAYASLMDCIVDTAADVALLQKRGIIVSGLGDSKEIALLFNKLCKEVAINDNECHLSSIFRDVNKHCNTRCNKWRATLNHDYFGNPWAIVSLSAAFFLFVLAITQTILRIITFARHHN